jgi:cephalosporin hydroxylase
VDDLLEKGRAASVEALRGDRRLRELTLEWVIAAVRHRYSHNFDWLGRPIIQLPQDVVALQEIVWRVRPRLIVETGVARGGSVVFYASLLELIGGDGLVVGVDVDIRAPNRRALEEHPLFRRIRLVEGSSVSEEVAREVATLARDRAPVLVALDSNHTHAHVLRELELYSPFVTRGSYLVVFDTLVADMPEGFFPDRPWGKDDNPKTAVREFLRKTDRFEVDRDVEAKLLITAAPEGYLRCVKD